VIFEGRIALITGATRGIGRAISLELARNGCTIAFNYSQSAALAERLASDLAAMGREPYYVQSDVADFGAAEKMVREGRDRFDRIDYLINNAGISYQGSVAEMSEETWDKVLDVNLKGPFLCSREVMPTFKQKRSGKIVNLGSLAGQVGGLVVGANYAASKAGVICFTKSLAKELAPFGINVNCIAPGVIDTEMTQPFPREEMVKSIPFGKLGAPQDVADAVLFLVSQESKYITGQTISVNGGIFMG